MKSAALSEGSWHLHTVLDQSPGLRALADTLADLCDEGHPIVACTADLKYSNGLFRFQERHPERFFQFGISEQNMVSAAAGIATTGPAARTSRRSRRSWRCCAASRSAPTSPSPGCRCA